MQISNIGGKHIVLACRTNILWDVLNQAQQIGCAANIASTFNFTELSINQVS